MSNNDEEKCFVIYRYYKIDVDRPILPLFEFKDIPWPTAWTVLLLLIKYVIIVIFIHNTFYKIVRIIVRIIDCPTVYMVSQSSPAKLANIF